MPILQDERLQEIAQLVSVTKTYKLYVRPRSYNTFGQEIGHRNGLWRAGGSIRWWKKAFADTGLDLKDFLTADGALFGKDLFGLKRLILSGDVNAAEAQAFLRNKFGGQLEFGDGLFAHVSAPQAEALAIDAEQPTEAEEGHQTLSERALEAKRILAGEGGSDAFQGEAILIDELPVEYDQRQVQQTLETLANRLNLELSELRSGRINYPTNGIDGAAIKPGTLNFEKTNFSSFYRKMATWPGPEDAIRLSVAPDTSVDRWHDAGELTFLTGSGGAGSTMKVKGPGRVQKVVSSRFTSAKRPTPGPTRYRIIEPGMRFGLVSICRVLDDSGALRDHRSKDALYELTYGCVLRGLPNFMPHAPQHIEVLYDGDVPAGLLGAVHDAAFNTPELYHSKANRDFATTPPRMLAPYSLLQSVDNYTPPQATLDDFAGFNVMLVTGSTPIQSYAQLNGRPNNYILLTGNPHGPMATTHDTTMQGRFVDPTSVTPILGEGADMPWRAPAPPCVVVSNDDFFTKDQYVLERNNTLPTGDFSRRVVNGVPFTLEDAERLSPTVGPDGSFAVYIEVKMRHRVPGGPHTLDPSIAYWQSNHDVGMRVGAWWTQGARVVKQGHRQTVVDITVW